MPPPPMMATRAMAPPPPPPGMYEEAAPRMMMARSRAKESESVLLSMKSSVTKRKMEKKGKVVYLNDQKIKLW